MDESNKYLDIGAQAYQVGNYEEAQKYYEISAKMGNSQAACNLGYIYEYGRTGEKDPEKAFYYYNEAAMEDNANACYKMGDAYLYGNFVQENHRLAFLYYQQALDLSRTYGEDDIKSDIYYRVALCYYDGIGVKKSYLEALNWINQAHTYSYYDRFNDKFMWQSTARRIANLREKIIRKLDAGKRN
ncbi:tetratricopeptide repeat protein [Lactobacillus sp. PSON]|uniref:tetratricopeptide repeat protein n=1 Tax=Lactobacillus sp. PSON TaxID=3455454 RepID=UPI00404148B5